MHRFFSPLLFLVSLVASAQERFFVVGTYDSPKSEGIYVFRFNSEKGTAEKISMIKTSNPSFVTFSPDGQYLYAVHETAPQDGKGGEVASFRFDQKTGNLQLINRERCGGDHPCHVATDATGRWLFVSNYTSGSLSVLPIRTDGSLGAATVLQHTGSGKDPQRQKGPHTHGAVPAPGNKQVLVTDLGIDKILLYDFDPQTGDTKPAAQPFVKTEPGAGPRLFTFHPNQRWGYAVEELSGTVAAYNYSRGHLKQLQRLSTMQKGDTRFAGSADIHVSPDGKFLYASNRGEVNNLAIYSIHGKKGTLKLVGHQPVLGKTPRNFSIDPSGQYLLCENQNSDEIVIFKRNRKTGLLTDTGNRIAVGKPVCIQWLPSH